MNNYFLLSPGMKIISSIWSHFSCAKKIMFLFIEDVLKNHSKLNIISQFFPVLSDPLIKAASIKCHQYYQARFKKHRDKKQYYKIERCYNSYQAIFFNCRWFALKEGLAQGLLHRLHFCRSCVSLKSRNVMSNEIQNFHTIILSNYENWHARIKVPSQ